MKLSAVRDLLDASPQNEYCQTDCEVYKACAADLLSDVLSAKNASTILLTGLIHEQVIRTAEMLDMSAVILVRGKSPSAAMVAMAEEAGLPLFVTKYDMYTSVGRLYQAGLRSLEE